MKRSIKRAILETVLLDIVPTKSQSSSTFIKEKSRRFFKSIADIYYFILVIIYPRNVPGCVVAAKKSSFPIYVGNAPRGLVKVLSTAAKKMFAAKLRKIRWRIYREIDLKRGNIVKSMKHYRRQVRWFLRDFEEKLKSEEPLIRKLKVSKTSDDVFAFKRIKRLKPQSRVCYFAHSEAGIDAFLPSLSAVFHFARANTAAQVKENNR